MQQSYLLDSPTASSPSTSLERGVPAGDEWGHAGQPSGRLVLATGVDVGLSRGAQRISLFAGLTWGIGRFLHPQALSRTRRSAW